MSKILYTTQIPSNVSDYIQGLELEKNAREGLVLSMIQLGIDPNSPNAIKYMNEYVEFSIQSNIAKNEMQKTYVPSEFITNNTNWALDYNNHTLTVYAASDEGGCKTCSM